MKIHIFIILAIFIASCTKKKLAQTTLILNKPIEQQVFHKNDTVFIFADMSYEKKINDFGFFCALVNDANDSTFFQRTILPVENPYKIQEYYINDFSSETNVTLNYGKRNVKTGQIYEIKEIALKFIP